MKLAQRLRIVIPGACELDAGMASEADDCYVITPPEVPMLDQLVAYLDTVPYRYSDTQTRHLSIGLAALCVRWGSYFATLTDVSSEPHPVLVGHSTVQSDQFSMISDSEMKRMNIEVTYNIVRLVQIYRERGLFDFYQLLAKAHQVLPMPHKSVTKDSGEARQIYASLLMGNEAIGGVKLNHQRESSSPRQPVTEIPVEHADRYLANILACHAWRNTQIEDIHAGFLPEPRLIPHQQRLTKREQQSTLREITANLGAVLFAWENLFDANFCDERLPTWLDTACAMANSWYGMWVSPEWSLVDTSSTVTLY